MPDLADFLIARIAERETRAQCLREQLASGYYDSSPDWLDLVDDPARVLADCAAKRAIVEMHRGAHECPTADSSCGWCVDSDECETLQALALPYAEHPDYRPEWAPAG